MGFHQQFARLQQATTQECHGGKHAGLGLSLISI
jgi:hypothetical protein